MPSPAQLRAERLEALPFVRNTSAQKGIFSPFIRSAKEILAHSELLGLLVRRELKARYKDSSLGFVWSLIKPLTMLLIYYVAIGQFLGAARGIADFAIFIYAGLTIWLLYSEIVATGTTSIVQNAGLIKKVYLPREIFPLASAGSALFNFSIQLIVLLGATAALWRFPFTWNLLYLPVVTAIVLLYGVALAILLSALNVFLRDIGYLVEVVMLVLFWASPIVYSWSFVVAAGKASNLPWLEQVYLLNPMSVLVIAFQKGIWAAGSEERPGPVDATGALTTIPPQPWPPDLDLRLVAIALLGIVLLWVAQRVFGRLQGNFAQEI